MRKAFIISLAAHTAIITAGLVNLSGSRPLEEARVQSVPVDIISEEALSQVTRGSEEAEIIPDEQTPASAGQSDKPKDTATEGLGIKDSDVSATVKTTMATPSASDNAPPPAPEPQPEEIAKPAPQPAEPEPVEAAPEEVKTDSKPQPVDWAAMAPPVPSSAPKPRQQERKPVPPATTASVSKPTPTPASSTPDHQSRQFDSDRIAALLNKSPNSGGGGANDETPRTLGRAQGLDARLMQSELDALRRQIARCWNPPVGAAQAHDLVVQIRMDLSPEGQLQRAPEVVNNSVHPFFAAAADSALRAVHRCAPYSMPAEKYDVWKAIVVNFDPRDMLR
jgi:outer membrane biosynthesis protein TonB